MDVDVQRVEEFEQIIATLIAQGALIKSGSDLEPSLLGPHGWVGFHVDYPQGKQQLIWIRGLTMSPYGIRSYPGSVADCARTAEWLTLKLVRRGGRWPTREAIHRFRKHFDSRHVKSSVRPLDMQTIYVISRLGYAAFHLGFLSAALDEEMILPDEHPLAGQSGELVRKRVDKREGKRQRRP